MEYVGGAVTVDLGLYAGFHFRVRSRSRLAHANFL